MKHKSHFKGNARELFLEPNMRDNGLKCKFRLILFQFHKVFIVIEQITTINADFSNISGNISYAD